MATPAAKTSVFLQLVKYFGSSDYKGTLANVPKSFFAAPLLAEGWIPLKDLAGFKKMQALVKSPAEIIEAIAYVPSGLFEVSPDSQYVRRTREFDAAAVCADLANYAMLAGFAVEAVGFDDGVSAIEVQSYFGRFGPIERVTAAASSWDPRFSTAFSVEFGNLEGMVSALVADHVYEDCPIQVRATSKADGPAVPTITATTLAFPKNRILEFRLAAENDTLTKAAVQAAFEALAGVKTVEYTKGGMLGHVQFKKAVAREIVGVIGRSGGVRVHGELLAVRALEGDEERLYWTVATEKQKLLGPTKISEVDLMHAARFAKMAAGKRRGGAAAAVRYHQPHGNARAAGQRGKSAGRGKGKDKAKARGGASGDGSGAGSSSGAHDADDDDTDGVDGAVRRVLGAQRGQGGVRKAGSASGAARGSGRRRTGASSRTTAVSMDDLLASFNSI
ncbi:hypothetical protein HK105_204494 [Polyrhizophydium stewartii]|uniref:HTH La-type RNA-binding domain-containing protein n=1 Tax=Polyrhizophydium stewartii TaxID=2732419 RepID=A0ABR4N976_9FUNG